MTPTPFQISISDDVLTDLRERLARVRWPDEAPGAPWQFGTSVDWRIGFSNAPFSSVGLYRCASGWSNMRVAGEKLALARGCSGR